MFAALLRRCSERDLFALCRYIPRRNTPPRFVALVPQREELDQNQMQITPPGDIPPLCGVREPLESESPCLVEKSQPGLPLLLHFVHTEALLHCREIII